MSDDLQRYLYVLSQLTAAVTVTGECGDKLSLDRAVDALRNAMHTAHDSGGKVIFLGNGGSAGTASHMAIDFSKNGQIRAVTFSDVSALTCLANDYGFENIFAQQVAWHGCAGDVLVLMSVSGESPDLPLAANMARDMGLIVVTFSGAKPDNSLRHSGAINFYIASTVYGFVEVAHLAIIHGILDLEMGWNGVDATVTQTA